MLLWVGNPYSDLDKNIWGSNIIYIIIIYEYIMFLLLFRDAEIYRPVIGNGRYKLFLTLADDS